MITELIVSLLAITGVVLNNKKINTCFPIWMISNFLCAVIHAENGLMILMLRDFVFFWLAVHGWYCWRSDKDL